MISKGEYKMGELKQFLKQSKESFSTGRGTPEEIDQKCQRIKRVVAEGKSDGKLQKVLDWLTRPAFFAIGEIESQQWDGAAKLSKAYDEGIALREKAKVEDNHQHIHFHVNSKEDIDDILKRKR